MPLTGKQRQHLRALAHHLDPVVQIGKEGVTEGVSKATERALLDHELIKVRIGTEVPDERQDAARALADATKAELVQVLGRTCLLYKRHPQKPKLKLPRAAAAPSPAAK
jgi:RNA-binding protein